MERASPVIGDAHEEMSVKLSAKIILIGAGLAGLSAAYELTQAGLVSGVMRTAFGRTPRES
jgi:heterodisulfide reductase subunit A-like polyferredoxin